MRRLRALGLVTAAALIAAAVAPSAASAHGIVGRTDLPIPSWMFGWAAAVVLVASFVGLAILWTRPRLEHPREREVLRIPRGVEVACGAIGIAIFVIVVYCGFAGEQVDTANLVPTFVYVAFWVGIPVTSAAIGDWFSLFNPWRAAARATGWTAARLGSSPEPMPYPRRLGRWPAVLGLVIFAWVELVYVNRDVPSTLTILILAYTAVQFVGMTLYGERAWSSQADAFAVYFNLYSRISPLDWRGLRILRRRFLSGLTGIEREPGTVALLVAAIGSTTFDGASNGGLWTDVEPSLQSAVQHLGFGPESAEQIVFTFGLLFCLGVVAGFYRLGIAGMHSVDAKRTTNDLAQRFVHCLVPIALAYVVAHYFSLFVFQGQALAYLASDPLGNGSNLFGTANVQIDYGVISSTTIWYVQVAALIAGHVTGLCLAHDRALALYRNPAQATRSQYWMLVIMVGFTSLGLWLLSAIAT